VNNKKASVTTSVDGGAEVGLNGATAEQSGLWPAARRGLGAVRRNRRAPLIGFLIALVVYFGLTTSGFLTLSNMTTVLSQVSILGILAVGETFVILLAGIDVSNGPLLALTGMVSGLAVLNHGIPVPVAMLVAIAVGMGAGLISGFFSYVWGMAPFVTTLAMGSFAAGMALVVTNGTTLSGFPASFNSLGYTKIGPVPLSVIILVLAFVVAWAVLRYTTFGRSVYAVGGNPVAARLSGISVVRVGIIVFVIAGAAAGLASLVNTGQVASAIPIAGTSLVLPTVAAVVIGGTSLFGGVGGVGGTFIGVLIIGTLNNGLAIANVNAFWDQAIEGIVIFVAVALDAYAQRRRARA
jgi:ribose/xylose/arabinose/galactoside ABC-type transport system permease subunit